MISSGKSTENQVFKAKEGEQFLGLQRQRILAQKLCSLPWVLRGRFNKILCLFLGTISGELGARKEPILVLNPSLVALGFVRYNPNLNLEFISSFGSIFAYEDLLCI